MRSARVCLAGYVGPQDGAQETALGTAVLCEVQRAAQATGTRQRPRQDVKDVCLGNLCSDNRVAEWIKRKMGLGGCKASSEEP